MSPSKETFPSLIVRPDGFEPQGAFAEAQAAYLRPSPEAVAELGRRLREQRVGVVAHFYMDPELQGVLSASDWPYIHISDSLLMADQAVKMAEAGMRTIAVLGVDFMSENVRAMLDAAGFDEVPAYRVATEPIGCSLAEAAESPAYQAYLDRAAAQPRSLHVIYVNTSLRTKAQAHHLVPTITCTSSNAVRTVLQAFSQIPELHLWYGPDSYMGANLRELCERLARMDERAVAALHPAHTPRTVAALLDRYHYFEEGICIVHHLFGGDVAKEVRAGYPDAFVTAHLEVPGEMFRLALDAQEQGRGVVGSTANILGFIDERVSEALRSGDRAGRARLRFVLGTEAGMVTPIVRRVQGLLQKARGEGGRPLEVEIVFPVADEAISASTDPELGVVPGVSGAEGCSPSGGCATCRYMKMNSLDALMTLLERLPTAAPSELEPYRPRQYRELVGGRTAAELGGEPILHMRGFQQTGRLPDALENDIIGRQQARAAAGA